MVDKKSGRPPKLKNGVTRSFKLDAELDSSLKDFAASCGQDVSDILREFVTGIVAANAELIEEYRARKSAAIKATFATPIKNAPGAQIDALKAGEDDENS